MEYLKSVLGGQPAEGKPESYAETVEKLVDRIHSSSLLEDRRDACRALKALSRKYRVEVGAQGMNGLCSILQSDSGDTEIVSYALETLCNITSPQPLEEEERPTSDDKNWEKVGEQFTEIFIKRRDHVCIVLGYLDEYSFRVRWPAVKLLANLVTNKPREMQELILISPRGVSKLMDLLGDNREVIRNDTLLLLIQLTKGNANIQKIVAFENAFDRLFEVINEEGYADGGIVVEDCLLFMLNLLKNNVSNQNFFKEGCYIQRLAPMFELPEEDEQSTVWLPQKVSNVFCVLEVIRSLVAPTNPTQVTAACQKVMNTSGILKSLCTILMANGVPVDILTESINAVGDIIRGNPGNQEFFLTIQAPSQPPREALVILLMSMVNEKQPVPLRCAVLYCFQSFLFKNQLGQSLLIHTLLPSTIDHDSVSTGQLLCAGIFSHDPLSNWFAAIGLAHSLIDNPVQHEMMLKVMLTPPPSHTPVSFLALVSELLQNNPRIQSKVGYLILLSTWFSHCTAAVNAFLEIASAIPYLTTQAAASPNEENEELVHGLCAFVMGLCLIFNDDTSSVYSKENLLQLIVKRIGIEMFLDRLNEITRHELYARALKHPQIHCKSPKELLLDYEFCKLFKILESMIVKAVTRRPNSAEDENGQETNFAIRQYKEVVRVQGRKVNELTSENETLKEHIQSYASQLDQLRREMEEVQQRNLELQYREFTLRDNINSTKSAESVDELKRLLQSKEENIKELEEAVSGLQKDQEDLMILMTDQEMKLSSYKKRLKLLGQPVDDDDEDDDGDNELVRVPTESEAASNGLPNV